MKCTVWNECSTYVWNECSTCESKFAAFKECSFFELEYKVFKECSAYESKCKIFQECSILYCIVFIHLYSASCSMSLSEMLFMNHSAGFSKIDWLIDLCLFSRNALFVNRSAKYSKSAVHENKSPRFSRNAVFMT